MLGFAFQILCAAGLFLCAIVVQQSLRNGPRNWEDVTKRLTSCDQRLLQLSYHPVLSVGLECPSEQLWLIMGGANGCMAMFSNAGVLLDALDFMDRDEPCSEGLWRATRHLRTKAVRLRVLIVAELFRRTLARIIRMNTPAPVGVAEAYVKLISEMSLTINDYRPDLWSSFERSIVTR